MPTLGNLTCRVERTDPDHTPLEEHATTYGDKLVESVLKVPLEPTPFTISLVKHSYVFEGLSMFVFIDGIYQCNRNRCDMRYSDENLFRSSESCQRGGVVDFRVRQKEEYLRTGECVGKAWTLMPFDATCSPIELHSASYTDQGQHCQSKRHIGTIEVLVLRCFSCKSNRSSLLDATPSGSTSPESATSPHICCWSTENFLDNVPWEEDGDRDQSPCDVFTSIAQHHKNWSCPKDFDGSTDFIDDDTLETGANMHGHVAHLPCTPTTKVLTMRRRPEDEDPHGKLRVQVSLALPCKSPGAASQLYQDSVSTRSSPDTLSFSSNAGSRPWFGAVETLPPMAIIQQHDTQGNCCMPCQVDGEWDSQDQECNRDGYHESNEREDNVTRCQIDTDNEWTSPHSETFSTTESKADERPANESDSTRQSDSCRISETKLFPDDGHNHEGRDLQKGPEQLVSKELDLENPCASQLDQNTRYHYIRYGPAERYIHNVGQPNYIDTLRNPFARFIFTYGSTTGCKSSKPSEHVAKDGQKEPLSQDVQCIQSESKIQEESGGKSIDDVTDIDTKSSYQNLSLHQLFSSDVGINHSGPRDTGEPAESLEKENSENVSVLEGEDATTTAYTSSASAIDSKDEVSGCSGWRSSQEVSDGLRDSKQYTSVEKEEDSVGQDDNDKVIW